MILPTLLLFTPTLAQTNNPSLTQSGILSPGPSSPELSSNATSTLSFSIPFNGTSTNFTWKISIAEINIPNNFNLFGLTNNSADLRVVNTRWSLDWKTPGDRTLREYLSLGNVSIGVSILVKDVSQSVRSKYDPNAGGNCESLLGSQCYSSVLQAAAATSPGSDGIDDFGSLNGCSDSLSGPGAGFPFVIDASTNPVFTASGRDDSLFYTTSEAYTAGNSTILKQAEGALQLLVLNINSDLPGPALRHGTMAVCRIVDASADTGTAALWRPSAVLWAIVAMMFVMLWQ